MNKKIYLAIPYSGMERHISKWKQGEDIDPESGLLHISHAACNALMLIEMTHLRPDLDDRPKEFYNQQKS